MFAEVIFEGLGELVSDWVDLHRPGALSSSKSDREGVGVRGQMSWREICPAVVDGRAPTRDGG